MHIDAVSGTTPCCTDGHRSLVFYSFWALGINQLQKLAEYSASNCHPDCGFQWMDGQAVIALLLAVTFKQS